MANPTKSSKNIIDAKDIAFITRLFSKNIWLFVVLPTIFFLFSYFYTYCLTNVYAAKTQILLKSNETYDYQNPLYKGLGYYGVYGDVTNQFRILQSHDLIYESLQKLKFDVSYYIVGRLKTTELYSAVP